MRIPAILVLTGATLAACSSPPADRRNGRRRRGRRGRGGADRPGFCYRTDRYGRVIYNRYGQPRVVRC